MRGDWTSAPSIDPARLARFITIHVLQQSEHCHVAQRFPEPQAREGEISRLASSRGAIYRVKSPIQRVHKAEIQPGVGGDAGNDWLTRLGLPEYAGVCVASPNAVRLPRCSFS
jgi:hypothetical protein